LEASIALCACGGELAQPLAFGAHGALDRRVVERLDRGRLGGMDRGVVPQATDLPSTRTGTCKVPDAKTLSRLAPTLGPSD
jgi:hypothetical protein